MDREAIEHKVMELGRDRARLKVRTAREKGRETQSPTGQYVMRQATHLVSLAVKKYLKHQRYHGDGSHDAYEPMNSVGSHEVIAALACRAVIDGLTTTRTFLSLASSIGGRLEDETRYKAFAKQHGRRWRWMRKKYSNSTPAFFKKLFSKCVAETEAEMPERWNKRQRMAVGAQLIHLVKEHTTLIVFRKEDKRRKGKHGWYDSEIDFVEVSPKTLAWLEESNLRGELKKPYWLPTPIPPLPWRSLRDGGYVKPELKYDLVRIKAWKTDATNEDYENYSFKPVLDAVNFVSRVAWGLNEDVHQVAKHYYETGVSIAGMPLRDEEPLPTRPAGMLEDDDLRKEWRTRARRVRDRNAKNKSKRLLVVRTFYMAQLYADLPRFFMPHMLCGRGRVYALPNFLQPQGPDLARAMLCFADKRKLENDRGEYWFYVEGANAAGVDKVPFDDRVAWVHEHKDEIKAIYHDPLDCTFWADQDKPWMFLSWCLEAGRLWEEGRDVFESQLAVARDGANNGLQIFSLLMRHRESAHATCVMPDPYPQDVYQIVADESMRVLKGMRSELAAKWRQFFGDKGVPRGAAKRITMTRPYGSVRHSAADFFSEWYLEHRDEYPNNPFEGDAFEACRFISGIIYDSVSEVCSSAEECMRYLQGVSDIFVENEARMIWTAPTGFPVIHAYKESKSSTIKTMLNERVRRVAFRERAHGYSKSASKNAISANYVHSLDAACLHLIVNKLRDRGVMNVRTIHDSFGVTPCEVDILDETIREVFVEVFSNDLLLKFHREAQALLPHVALPELPERGDPSMVPELLKSDYFFA